ncbi:hypothetical protein ASG71_09955 [Arthrobacter sp. Soil763]|nr:hypothetical protein ASG71_09955 [Arthrobacter sp. Soil763]
MGFDCCEFAKRGQGPHYTALRDFLTTFLALDPSDGERLADGEHLVVSNGLLGGSRALAGNFFCVEIK